MPERKPAIQIRGQLGWSSLIGRTAECGLVHANDGVDFLGLGRADQLLTKCRQVIALPLPATDFFRRRITLQDALVVGLDSFGRYCHVIAS